MDVHAFIVSLMNSAANKTERIAAARAVASVYEGLRNAGASESEATSQARREICGEFGCSDADLTAWEIEEVESL